MAADKSVLSDGCKSLVLQDLKHVLSRYFEVNGLPDLILSADGKGYRVTVTFSAELVKKFNVLK